MISGLAVNLSPPVGGARLWIHGIMALCAIVVFWLMGPPLVRSAWAGAWRRRIVVEQLFLLGIGGAFAGSIHATLTGYGSVYYEVVAVLLAIYTFGHLLRDRRRRAALQAADALRGEFTRCLRLATDGTVQEVDVAGVRPGDRVLVRPGDPISVDGEIRRGQAFVRETALTGEPFPVVRREGDTVFAGSQVLDQELILEAKSAGSARTLDRLLNSVEALRARPSLLQREADRVVQWFLPAVVAIALGTACFWTLRDNWIVGLFNGMAVTLVACPCALGLATPIGIWNALNSLTRRGVRPNSADLVEALSRVDTVVFDKTGTLSESELSLVDFVTIEGIDRPRLTGLIVAAEKRSNHPIGRAFGEWGKRNGVLEYWSGGVLGSRNDVLPNTPILGNAGFSPYGADNCPPGADEAAPSNGCSNTPFPVPTVDEVTTLPGIGLRATVGLDVIEVGNDRLLRPTDQEILEELRAQLREPGLQEVFVRFNGRLVALGVLRERLASFAADVLARLEASGYECRVMTGDRSDSAFALDLPRVARGLQPEQKAALVQSLESAGKRVLFVGDGINDAVAMSTATASLALVHGATIARENAGGIIQDIRGVVSTLAICRRIVQAIRTNLLFALGYNLVGITLAAAGLLHPVVAALLMLGSSVTVTSRALFYSGDSDRLVPARTRRAKFTPPTWPQWIILAGFAFAGPFLAFMGRFHLLPGLAISVALLLVGVWLAWLFPRLQPVGRMTAGMFAIGGIAMLAGWWADAGFGPVIRHGVCLCGCPKSVLGWGMISKITGMQLAMVFASLPVALWFGPVLAERSRRLKHWMICLLGMVAGMEVTGFAMAQISTIQPQLHFVLSFVAMMLGMTGGMLVCCRVLARFSIRGMGILAHEHGRAAVAPQTRSYGAPASPTEQGNQGRSREARDTHLMGRDAHATTP
jgi:heavy metal translocating P-type ATPase